MRRISQRVCCAYRTVSYAAAMLLTATPPVEFIADRMAQVFIRSRDMQRRGKQFTYEHRKRINQEARQEALNY